MKYIAVKNFETRQHYKDRGPKWIKLYNSLLDDYGFLALSETNQRHLVMIWLIASRHQNRIPNDLKYLAHAIHPKGKVDFASLFDAGFLVFVEQDASAVLAEPEQDASKNGAKSSGSAMLEKRERREEKKKQKTTRPAGAGSAFPVDSCNRLHSAWLSHVGATGYPRFRKALLPLFPRGSPPLHTESEMAAAIEAFGQVREAQNVDKQSWWHVEKFASEIHNWVRLGEQAIQNEEDGTFTERGRLVMASVA